MYEYFISTETIESIDYLDKSGQYKLYCRLRLLSVYVFKFQQHAVTVKELWIAPSRGVSSGTDSYSLQYSACAQLLNSSLRIELKWCFAVVRFDAANVMRHSAV